MFAVFVSNLEIIRWKAALDSPYNKQVNYPVKYPLIRTIQILRYSRWQSVFNIFKVCLQVPKWKYFDLYFPEFTLYYWSGWRQHLECAQIAQNVQGSFCAQKERDKLLIDPRMFFLFGTPLLWWAGTKSTNMEKEDREWPPYTTVLWFFIKFLLISVIQVVLLLL